MDVIIKGLVELEIMKINEEMEGLKNEKK
jgi:hypothetical protein